MVDCRPAAAAPHELPHAPPQENNHHAPVNQQAGGSGDMGSHITSPSGRASTPATTNAITNYSAGPGMNPGVNMGSVGNMGVGMGMGMGVPYVCKPGGVLWVPPPLPPPPQHVNPHVYKSVQANGADLPMNDIPTLRYYFNLGVECMWAAYGPPPPPRHYSPRDIAQDMQQMSLHERGPNHVDMNHKHKPPQPDKPLQNNGKGNGQRSLLGPRFNKRGNNEQHAQNKGHNNNNMPNKGPNNRGRGSVCEARGPYGEECVVEAPLLTLPYIPYPPPVYPVQYYPIDSEPAMMGMMAGMGYMGYEEGVEYGGGVPPAYYPHPYPHPHPHPHAMPPHTEHK